jgi:hypothetical protein
MKWLTAFPLALFVCGCDQISRQSLEEKQKQLDVGNTESGPFLEVLEDS